MGNFSWLKKKERKKRSHAGCEPDSEPPGCPGSELWFAGSQTPNPVFFMPKPRCQFEDLLCVSAAAAAGDASGGLVMVVSTMSHLQADLPDRHIQGITIRFFGEDIAYPK